MHKYNYTKNIFFDGYIDRPDVVRHYKFYFKNNTHIFIVIEIKNITLTQFIINCYLKRRLKKFRTLFKQKRTYDDIYSIVYR